jgi:hypothetical protein
MAKEIQVFVPQLPSTPGWVALSEKKREWLQEKTSNIAKWRQMQVTGVIGECRELFLIQEGLIGEKMTMNAYLDHVYGKSSRTGYKRLGDYRELAKIMPPEAIDALANDTQGIMQGTGGLVAGEVIRAAKTLPVLKSKEPKVIEGYMGNLREKLREGRQKRLKGRSRLDPEDAMKMWITAGKRLLREAKITESAGQRAWIKKAVGYLMETRAITGTVSTERIPIPDGFMPVVGRPRKHVKS